MYPNGHQKTWKFYNRSQFCDRNGLIWVKSNKTNHTLTPVNLGAKTRHRILKYMGEG